MAATLEQTIKTLLPIAESEKNQLVLSLEPLDGQAMPVGAGTTSTILLVRARSGGSTGEERRFVAKCFNFEENDGDARIKHLFRNELQWFTTILPLAAAACPAASSVVPAYYATHLGGDESGVPHVLLFEHLADGEFLPRDALLSGDRIAAVLRAYAPLLQHFRAGSEAAWIEQFGNYNLLEYITGGIRSMMEQMAAAQAAAGEEEGDEQEDAEEAEPDQAEKDDDDEPQQQTTEQLIDQFAAMFPHILGASKGALEAMAMTGLLEKLAKLEAERDVASSIRASAEYLIQGPVSIFHGDLQPTNLFFPADASKQPRLLDWQAVGLGNPLFDAVRFATQSAQDAAALRTLIDDVILGELATGLLEPEVARKSVDSLLWCELCTYVALSCSPLFQPLEDNGGFDRVLARGFERTIDLLATGKN